MLQVLREPEVIFSLGLTVKVALSCLLLHLFTAPLLALWVQSPRNVLRRPVNFLLTLPLVFPPVAMGYVLLLALGQAGLGPWLEHWLGLRLIFSQGGVIVAAYVAGLPLVIKPIQAALASDELHKLVQAARVTGASPRASFFLIVLPHIRRSLAVGLLLGVTRSFGEVGISLMLGGNIAQRTNTLSLEVFNAVSQGDFIRATVLCVILAIVSLGLYIALDILERRA